MNEDGLSQEQRAQEADRIFRALFARPAPASLIARYQAVWQSTLAAPIAQLAVDPWWAGALDLEALEFYLRHRDPQNNLTRSFRIVLYLAEVERGLISEFFTDRHQPFRAWLAILAAPGWSVWQYLKGRRIARALLNL